MPTLYITLPETQKSILSDSFYSVVKDVIYQLGIPCSSVVAIHQGMEINRTDNRTNTSINSAENLPATVSQRRIVATINEEYDEDSLSSTTVSQKDVPPIFNDYDIDALVYTVYVKSQISVDIEYSCASRTEANRIRDDIRVKLSQGRNILHHSVEYNILVPLEVEEFIADVYDLKSRLFPQTLIDYFKSYSSNHIRPITDMANAENARSAVFERQVRVVGVMDISSEVPKVEQNNDTNTYSFVVPYKFTLDVPRGMCIKYPPMICNRLMPAKYLEFVQERKIKQLESFGYDLIATQSLAALSKFESQRQLSDRVNINLPLNLPLFDEFHDRVGHKGYVITTSFLTDVDETDKKTLINLKELGDFYLNETLLEFVRTEERRWIVNPYMSPFYLGLHQSRRHHDNNILTIDDQLNVSSQVELSLVRPVRICLSVCLDLTTLNPTVMPRLMANKNFYLIYLHELIRGINNYRAEFSRMGSSEHTFYRQFILMLNDAVNKEEVEFVKDFMSIFTKDRRMTQVLVATLRMNYPRLYNKILDIIEIDHFKPNDQDTGLEYGVERYNMRKHMYFQILAMRMEDIGKVESGGFVRT